MATWFNTLSYLKDTDVTFSYNIIQLLTDCVSLPPKPQHKNLVFASLDRIIHIFLCAQFVQNITHGADFILRELLLRFMGRLWVM